MIRQVAVVDAFNDTVKDVAARAEASFQRNMAEYRRLVTKMADTGGELPQDAADELIRICEALGIPPDQLADDAAAILTTRSLEQGIADVHRRNADRTAPLPELQRKVDDAQKRYREIQEQWEPKLKAANEERTAAQRAYESVLNARMESAERLERQLMEAHEWRPHLFGPITRESLKRSLDPRRTRTIR